MRQYKDLDTALTLTRSSTMLATVDNLSMADANKAVESTMNALGMAATNQATAYTNSMKIVDSWSALAHEASISANDLAGGVERSAGAAHQAGVSLDQLNALIAAGVRNTGLSGDNVGNMWKSVLANISVASPKVQKAFDELGISMYTVGQNGQKVMKPVYDLIVQLAGAAQHATVADSQWFETIAGGKYQYSKLMSSISDVTTIQDDYTKSVESTGKANALVQDQLNTISADMQRLRDTIQQLAHSAESNGLGDMFKAVLSDINNLIVGLEQMPKWMDMGLLKFAEFAIALKVFSSLVGSVRTVLNSLNYTWKALQVGWDVATAALIRQKAATTSVTAALAAKTAVEEADIVASGAQAGASTAVVGALEAETVAAGEAAAAFTALDVVSGGLALVIGLAVTGTMMWAMHLGSLKQSADGATTSMANLNQQINQQTQTAQTNISTTTNNINQLQNLKSQYESLSKTLATTKQGTDAYNKTEAALMDVKQQMIGIIGAQKTAQVLASKDVVGALNSEIEAMLNAQLTELTATNDRLKAEQNLTDGVVTQSNKRIDAYQNEINAISQAAQYRGQHAFDTQGAINPQANVDAQSNIDAISAQQENTWQKQSAYKSYLNRSNAGPVGNAIAQVQTMLDQFKKNNNTLFNNGGSGGVVSPTGSSTGSTKSSGAGSTSAYTEPFKDLAQNDDIALQSYTARIKSTSDAISEYSTALSNSITYLQSHITDTKAASDVMSKFNSETSAVKSQMSAYNDENAKINQLLPTVKQDITNVNSEFAHGKISADAHRQSISTLNSEYTRLNDTLASNQKALVDDTQKMSDATKSVSSEIVSMLQQAYTDEEAMQQTALTNIYQPQIDALNNQKTAIDGVISSLQSQWAAQDQVNQLTDLQSQLSAVQADKRFEIINTDGSKSYTYDTAKASDISKQIQDLQTKQAHDAEIQRLTDSKTALDAQLTIIQKNYADAKTALSTYWAYKLSQDNLQQTADNLILQNGIAGALGIVQKYSSQIVAQYNAIQSAAAGAAGAMLGGIGLGGGVPSGGGGGSSSSGGTMLRVADGNGRIDTGPVFSDLVNMHGGQWMDHKWVKGSYVGGKWTPAHLDTGGYIPHGKQGLAMLHENEIVLNSPIVDKLKNLLVTMPKLAINTPSSSTVNHTFNISRVELPNVNNGQSFVDDLTSFTQQLARHGKGG